MGVAHLISNEDRWHPDAPNCLTPLAPRRTSLPPPDVRDMADVTVVTVTLTTTMSRRCRDCGVPFVVTAGEQRCYASASKDFSDTTRCSSCKALHKAALVLGTLVAAAQEAAAEAAAAAATAAAAAAAGAAGAAVGVVSVAAAAVKLALRVARPAARKGRYPRTNSGTPAAPK